MSQTIVSGKAVSQCQCGGRLVFIDRSGELPVSLNVVPVKDQAGAFKTVGKHRCVRNKTRPRWLTTKDAREMKELRDQGLTYLKISKELKISESAVWQILNGNHPLSAVLERLG